MILKLERIRCSKVLEIPCRLLKKGMLSLLVIYVVSSSLIFVSTNATVQDAHREPQPAEPIDEATQLEARRKRREAIRAKYRGQATPLRLQALHIAGDGAPSTPNSEPVATNNAASGMWIFVCVPPRGFKALLN